MSDIVFFSHIENVLRRRFSAYFTPIPLPAAQNKTTPTTYLEACARTAPCLLAHGHIHTVYVYPPLIECCFFRTEVPRTVAPSVPEESAARAAPSAAPTAAPTVAATLVGQEEQSGFLGPGFMSGYFSADGVPKDVVAAVGEEGVVRQVCGCIAA